MTRRALKLMAALAALIITALLALGHYVLEGFRSL